MAFSPDAQCLLSVSRDRRWSLFKRHENSREFSLYATVDKKTSIHTRIIWCCAWSPDSQYFTTGSRDGKVVVWEQNEESSENITLRYISASNALDLKEESVTALAFAPKKIRDGYFLTIGLESGSILLYEWTSKNWKKLLILNKEYLCQQYLFIIFSFTFFCVGGLIILQ